MKNTIIYGVERLSGKKLSSFQLLTKKRAEVFELYLEKKRGGKTGRERQRERQREKDRAK